MKKFFMSCLCAGLCLAAVAASAAEKSTGAKTNPASESTQSSVFQVFIWKDVPSGLTNIPVYGVRIGLPFSGGRAKTVGAEVGVLGAMTDDVYGFQGSLITALGKEIVGAQVSLANFADTVDGFQFGIFNMAKSNSFQIGLVNIIEDSSIPFFPFLNFKF